MGTREYQGVVTSWTSFEGQEGKPRKIGEEPKSHHLGTRVGSKTSAIGHFLPDLQTVCTGEDKLECLQKINSFFDAISGLFMVVEDFLYFNKIS